MLQCVENIALQSLQMFSLFCYVRIVTTFGSKMITVSLHDTIVRKFANFARLDFPYFTTFRHQIFEFYSFIKVLSRNFVFLSGFA